MAGRMAQTPWSTRRPTDAGRRSCRRNAGATIADVGTDQPARNGSRVAQTEHEGLPSLLECGQAQRQSDGRYLVTGAKYQTFHEDGKGELTVEAPQCIYDSGQRSISSPGPLHVSTADGKFAIEGEGFLWQQTNSMLLVSNRVLSCWNRRPPTPP